MGKGITEAVIEEIKTRTDLADLVSSYGIALVTAGSSKKACCPFHNEKTPSFHINESRGFYHCFGCGETGDAIKFVEKMEGLTFVEAVKKLAAKCGIEIDAKEDPELGRRTRLYALMAEVAQFYRRCLVQTPEAALARDYLASRDLGEDVQEAWTIGYAPQGVPPMIMWAEKNGYSFDELVSAGLVKAPDKPGDLGYHRFGGRLMFTIRDKQGRVVAFSGRQLVAAKNSGKYVNSPETPIFKKSRVLFGFDKAAGNIAKSAHHEVIVCEGQIDTIRLHMSGFPFAVASQGTAFTEEHVKMLRKVSDQVTLVFDDDLAGHKATIRTAGLFLASGMPVKTVRLPGGNDPDSFLRTHPREEFQKLLDGAESIMSFQVRAERAKEKNPETIDAVARISKAVLQTIAQSSSEILKSAMLGEASKLLGLPNAALAEELRKIRPAPVRAAPPPPAPDDDDAPDDGAPDEDSAAPLEGEDAGAATPPTEREMSFCAFLQTHEGDRAIDAIVGELLPQQVFSTDFVRHYVEAWRLDVIQPEREAVITFVAGLTPREHEWYDKIFRQVDLSRGSDQTPLVQLDDFIRYLWIDHLTRMRGALPVTRDVAINHRRLRLTTNLKRMPLLKGEEIKGIIRGYIKGE